MAFSSSQETNIFLSSYIDFRQHLEDLWNELSNVEKGTRFAELVKNTLSTQKEFSELSPNLNKHSHDDGVDISWIDTELDRQKICCQCKFHIRSKDDIDNIISKFSNFDQNVTERSNNSKEQLQLDFLNENQEVDSDSSLHYYIVTLWNLNQILDKYCNSNLSSVSFYKQLIKEKRLDILDGEQLYKVFLNAYGNEFNIPKRIQFKVSSSIASHQGVHVGVMNASDLIEIYKQSGDGIFFENVRDFIGREEKSSSSEINNEIFKTAKNEPSRMLERNNGITFKASSLTKSDEGLITLENAGIINGCQTTVCISEAQPQSDCFVVFKVVVTDEEEDSLTIAKTANTQNKIEKINLELSEFVRPQLLKIALSEIGLKIDDNSNAPIPSLASSIAIKNVIKTDLRGLFIALFSSPPRNVFRSDYSAIRFDDVRTHFRGLAEKKRLITLLARLILVCDVVIQDMKENNESSQSLATDKVFKLYKRFFEEGKNYKSGSSGIKGNNV
jgi:hypothetical protein